MGQESEFIRYFNLIQKDCFETAKEKGWHDKPIEDGTLIALMHSDLSEALEALRKGNDADDKIPEFNRVEAELAGVIIRIMDMAEKRNLRIAEALIVKKEMNKTRKYKHGGKEV